MARLAMVTIKTCVVDTACFACLVAVRIAVNCKVHWKEACTGLLGNIKHS
jgi:hypothetical protein